MIYSSFKVVHNMDRIEDLKNKVNIMPTQIQVDLTNACNHHCPYCFYRCARNKYLNALFNDQDRIPYEIMVSLLNEFRKLGIGAVQYTGGGEPFKHGQIYEILEYTILSNLHFAIVTNGGMINPHKNNILAKADWIRVSLDASQEETYLKSHNPDYPFEFNLVLDNIKSLVEDCPDTIIGVSFVVNPVNWKEIVSATNLVKSLGVDNIRFSVAYTPRGMDLYKGFWPQIEKLALEARKLGDEKFKVFDLIMPHLENLELKQKGYDFCGYQYFTAVIGADMEVYPCCTLKYNQLSKLGNLKQQNFLEVWNGKQRLDWLKKDHLKLVCDKNPCWMDSKNQFISYLIKQDAPHINYI